MFKLFKKKNTLNCFSPEVMLATFVIEIILAIYVFIRYRMTAFGRMAVAILVLLAVFQMAEYQICAGSYTLLWARIAIIVTTLLPILGLHLILMVGKATLPLRALYIVAIASILFFSFSQTAITGAVCGGNYIIFNSTHSFYWLYGVYYTSFLFIGIWRAYEQMLNFKKSGEHKKISVLRWMIAGYLSFMIPMAIIYSLYDYERIGITSIMCGFAIIFAFILALRIVPLFYRAEINESKK